MKRLTALALSLLVHAGTLAFMVFGVWTIVVNSEFVFGWLVGAGMIALGWMLRPRLGGIPRDAEVLDRATVPEFHDTADRIADRMGVRRPARVAVLDLATGASCVRAGVLRRPVLVVGLPIWLALSPRQRVTLLARAYAGVRRGGDLFVDTALATLGEWRQALMGAAPLRAREEAHTKITASLGALDSPSTAYEAAGWFGRTLGRVLCAPILLLEPALSGLARSGEAGAREHLLRLAGRVVTAEEVAELEELIASHRYLAPMQAAVLRGENVPAIRRGALARSRGVSPAVFESPATALLGSAESDRIDDELLRHYTRAIRGFGLIT